MRRTLRFLRVRTRRGRDALLRARRRRRRCMAGGGALLLLLTLPLRLRALPLLCIALLLLLLGIALLLLLRGALLLCTRGRLVLRSEVALRARRLAPEHDARVERPLPNGRGAIGGRGLMRGRYAVDPDSAHSRRRPVALGHTARIRLCVECRRGQCKAGEECCETLHGAPGVV